ncbi:hypothetical protein BDV96DRAFT_645338 [Lophiotrema nucula]|uniref:Uncharacterized protein n=1 Tax=Lophiotrema nucula TaxID=690887 RepID=A0A6A5ZBP7_9PLEO|nr:hypothetical protein BDV96DRAFT_645338 [Lophiotrema nucula]
MRYAYNFLQLLVLFVCWQHASLAVPASGYSTDLHIDLNPVNDPTSDKQNMIVYTSVVDYDFQTSEFTDNQIAGIAEQAWLEMKQAHEAWGRACGRGRNFINQNQPFMMSAIAVGTQIYFSSSMKKNSPNALLTYKRSDGTVTDQDTVITRALAQCRVDQFDAAGDIPSEDLHKNKGNCGEIVASALHYARNKAFPWEAPNANVRVVAFGGKNGEVTDPCQWDDPKQGPNYKKRIACRNWVDWKKMKALTTAGGVVPERVSRAPKDHFQPNLNEVFLLRTPQQLDA